MITKEQHTKWLEFFKSSNAKYRYPYRMPNNVMPNNCHEGQTVGIRFRWNEFVPAGSIGTVLRIPPLDVNSVTGMLTVQVWDTRHLIRCHYTYLFPLDDEQAAMAVLAGRNAVEMEDV